MLDVFSQLWVLDFMWIHSHVCIDDLKTKLELPRGTNGINGRDGEKGKGIQGRMQNILHTSTKWASVIQHNKFIYIIYIINNITI